MGYMEEKIVKAEVGKQVDPTELNTLQNILFKTVIYSSASMTSPETVTSFNRACPLALMMLQKRRGLLSSSEKECYLVKHILSLSYICFVITRDNCVAKAQVSQFALLSGENVSLRSKETSMMLIRIWYTHMNKVGQCFSKETSVLVTISGIKVNKKI